MDRLAETVAAYLCRHRSVGLLRLTLDLTRRRLDLSAEIGAAEVVKGAVAPPTPDTETWRRAAVRKAVYTLRKACPIRAEGGGSQLDRLVDNPTPSRPPLPPSSTARALFSTFFLFLRDAEKRRLYPTCGM